MISSSEYLRLSRGQWEVSSRGDIEAAIDKFSAWYHANIVQVSSRLCLPMVDVKASMND